MLYDKLIEEILCVKNKNIKFKIPNVVFDIRCYKKYENKYYLDKTM